MLSVAYGERKGPRGFTTIEVVVVIAVITLLAGIVVPTFVDVSQDTKESELLAVYDSIQRACEQHHEHTSTTAREFTDSRNHRRHELSIQQDTPGWQGPYLDHPLTPADNPFAGHIMVYETFTQGGANAPRGFDLHGSGTDSASGNGQYVMFYDVPEAAARAVNDALDQGVGGDWTSTGRVRYVSRSRRLNMFLLDLP